MEAYGIIARNRDMALSGHDGEPRRDNVKIFYLKCKND
jgi:hypothetical protein